LNALLNFLCVGKDAVPVIEFKKEDLEDLFKSEDIRCYQDFANKPSEAVLLFPRPGCSRFIRDGRVSFGLDSVWNIEKSLNALTKEGCIVSVVPTVHLESPMYRGGAVGELQEVLLKDNVLDMVVSLPGRLLGTSVEELSIVRLRKNRREDEKVTFVDARKMYKEGDGRRVLDTDAVMEALQADKSGHRVSVSPEEVQAKGHNLTAEHFVDNIDITISENGYRAVPLEFLGGMRWKNNEGRGVGKIVHPSDLNKTLGKRELDKVELSEDVVTGMYKLTEEAILLSLVGELRPTLCKATKEDPVYFGSGVCAFVVDEDDYQIDPLYVMEKL
jgi:hypothetical protein